MSKSSKEQEFFSVKAEPQTPQWILAPYRCLRLSALGSLGRVCVALMTWATTEDRIITIVEASAQDPGSSTIDRLLPDRQSL